MISEKNPRVTDSLSANNITPLVWS